MVPELRMLLYDEMFGLLELMVTRREESAC